MGVSRDPTAVIKATLKLIYYVKRSEKTLAKTACINIHICSKNRVVIQNAKISKQ